MSQKKHDINDKLMNCISVEEVLSCLTDVDNLFKSAELNDKEAEDLYLFALHRLKEFTDDNPKDAGHYILDYLLPLIRTKNKKIFVARCKDLLISWINQYDEADRSLIRSTVLEQLSSDLVEPDRQHQAILTISDIGYRDEKIYGVLREMLTSTNNELADTALFAITRLGVPSNDEEMIVAILSKRMRVRMNWQLVNTARAMANHSIVKDVLELWLDPSKVEGRSFLNSLSLRIPADAADIFHDDLGFQQGVWRQVFTLLVARPDSFKGDFALGSDLAPSFNDTNVIPDLLNSLPNILEPFRFALYHRVIECVRPFQLEGWNKDLEPETIQMILSDALRISAQQSTYSWTEEGLLKDLSWNCLMNMGYHDFSYLFEKGIVEEKDEVMQHHLSEYLASFPNESLEEKITLWLDKIGKRQAEAHKNEQTFAIKGALSLLGSICTLKALRMMLNEDFIQEGRILQQHVDIVAHVGRVLSKESREAIDLLVNFALTSESPRLKELIIASLSQMKGYILAEDVLNLLPLIHENTLDVYCRSLMVNMLAQTDVSVSVELQHNLRQWAIDRSDWLGWSALEFFARKGLLQADVDLLRKIGIRKNDQVFEVVQIEQVGSFIIGLMYQSAPDDWKTVISKLLRTGSWEDTYPIIKILQETHGRGETVDKSIHEALLERTFRDSTIQLSVEPQLFLLVAKLFPKDFVNEIDRMDIHVSLPNARLAAVKACSLATKTDSSVHNAVTTFLLQMCGDSSFRVRRAALSSLSGLSQLSIIDLCNNLSASKLGDVRRRAAEAAAWIEDENIFENRYQSLISDKEPRVRNEMNQSRISRRNRKWSGEYFARIKGKNNNFDKENIIELWKYGRALTQLGNEDLLSELKEFHSKTDWWPCQAHWIKSLIEALEKKLTDEISKKSEQWTPEEASVERLSGEIIIENQKIRLPLILIWTSSRATPIDKSSWGGSAILTGQTVRSILMAQPTICQVILNDGRTGTALIKQFTEDYILFIADSELRSPESSSFF